MGTFMGLLIVGAIIYGIVKIVMSNNMVVNDDVFSQAGVKVEFKTGKITIRGKTYDVNDVKGIEHRKAARLGTEVYIKVDDFKCPIHKVGISGSGDAGERFVQRLETALRKAGGPSFY